MQQSASNNNKKQKKSVQNLSENKRTEMLLNSKEIETKSRAKYLCNARLAELIQIANILPPKFDFDWNVEKGTHGFENAFEKFKKLFFELSVTEQFDLVGADLGKRYISYPTSLSKKLRKQDEYRFCLRALDNSQEVIKNRNFLKRTIALFKITQEKEINDLISADEDAFDAFNKLYSDIEPLYTFLACWKIAEHLRGNLDLINAKHRNGVIIYLTAQTILLGEQATFGISDNEATEFIEEWKKLFIIKDLKSENAKRLIVILDVLLNNAFSLETPISQDNLSVNRDGNIKFQLSIYAEALEGVNISRLRICEYCKKLFWASRKDAYTCSPKHARNRRMRLLRENWKEKGDLYLKARQKKAKKKKESKNGSL